jgi:hypothetical protein
MQYKNVTIIITQNNWVGIELMNKKDNQRTSYVLVKYVEMVLNLRHY